MYESLNQINEHYKIKISFISDSDYSKYNDIIINIFNSNIKKYENTNDDMINNTLGLYYSFVVQDYDKMKFYFKKAIKNGYYKSANNLAAYYLKIEHNYNKMKHYYKKSIKLNNNLEKNIISLGHAHFAIGYTYTIHPHENYDKMKYNFCKAVKYDIKYLPRIILRLKENDQYLLLKHNGSNINISPDIINQIKNYKIAYIYENKYCFKTIFNIIYLKN